MDHDWLLDMLALRIDDKAFLNLIRKWLKAGILDTDGQIIHPEAGTPQGGLWKAFHNEPCGTPSLAARNKPLSTWPALINRQSKDRKRASRIRFRTQLINSL